MRGADSSLLGLALTTDWIAGKGSSLLGKRVASPQDLATLGAVLRDPRAETFRYFLVKEGKIIYHSAVTSCLTGSSAAFAGKSKVFLADIKATMGRLGADGYYLMHNHSSRLVKASILRKKSGRWVSPANTPDASTKSWCNGFNSLHNIEIHPSPCSTLLALWHILLDIE